MSSQTFQSVAAIPRSRTPEDIEVSGLSAGALRCRPAFEYEDVELAVHRREQALLVGSGALWNTVEKPKKAGRYYNSLDQLRAASEGNVEGYNGALTSIFTAIGEAANKIANSVEVTGEFDEQHRFVQFDMTSDDFLANTFEMYGVSDITCVEARDMFRFEELFRAGRMGVGEQYHVLSLIPKKTREELVARSYFLESMSLVHRVMTLDTDGKVRIRSNFIAGVDMQRIEQELGDGLSEQDMIARQERALELRHDHELARQFYASIGIHLPNSSAETVLDKGFITPAGCEDEVVRRLDQIAAGITGKDWLFYGTREPGDYQTFQETSKQRAESFRDIAHTVLSEAIEYVRAGLITAPEQVPGLFRELIKNHLVDRAIYCNDIDLRVLGTKAATHIIMAQSALMHGDFGRFEKLRLEAQAVAVVTDCPFGKRKRQGGGDSNSDNPLDDLSLATDSTIDGEESGVCDYRIDSCYCSPYNIDGTDAPKPLDVKVTRDQTGDATCTRCDACINEKGEVKSYGYIKARADMLKLAAETDHKRQQVARQQGLIAARSEVALAA